MFKTKLEVDRHVDNSLKKINNETERNLRCFSFAKLYFKVGDYEHACRYVSLYLSVKPKSAEGHHLLGKALEKLGKKEAALEAYRKSLQLDSKQNNLVIKVCELLASDDVDMDKAGARYFCDLAQSFDPHNSAVFNLKERLITTENENPSDVTKLLLDELESRPTDVNLRVRLLKHFLQNNMIKEAYKHASDIDSKDMAIFHNNISWYETFAEVLVRYQRDLTYSSSLTWEFWFLSVSVLDRLVALSLDDHVENLKSSTEYLTILFNFDQMLSKASQNIGSCPDRQLSLVFLNHYHAQLYFHMATCLFKQAKKDFIQFKEASNITLPVLLAAYHSQPADIRSMWLNNCPDSRRRLIQRWHKLAAFRCSQTGHILLALMKDRKSVILDKAAQYSTGMWREQLFKKLFVKRDQQQKMNTSFFINSSNLLEPVLKMPEASDVLQFDETAQLIYPDSLHHHIWIAVNNNISSVDLKCFDGLTYSVRNLNNCAAESLNVLDIQSFIYCAALCAKSKLEETKNLIYYNNDKPSVLPASITDSLGTVNQSKFLTAAYKMYKNEQTFNTGEIRILLITGIEVVRCVGHHGLDVKMLVKLANIFEERSKTLSKQSEIEFNDARAELYWNTALPLLEKMKNNQAVTYSSNRLFEYKSKEMTMSEVTSYIEKGKLFTAVQLMKKKEHDRALHTFELLKDPYASYYQSQIYKHMADQKTNQNKENVTSEMRSQNIILLSKARDCLYLTLDRLREPSVDRSHPLNIQLGSDIEKIERLLSRIDPDCTNRNECDGMSDENVSSDSAGEHYLSTYTTHHSGPFTPKHDIHNHHSTPFKLEMTRREARPSPERLDAQLRQLAANKDVALNNILEQNKLMVDSHRSLLEELRSFRDAVNNLTATVDDLKSIKHGMQELKEIRDTVQGLKHSVDDFQNVADVVRELKKDIGELKKDSSKAAQLSEEDLYVLDPDYGVDYGLNANLGQYNPNLYQNYQGRLSVSSALNAGSLAASYGPPGIYPGLYPAMAAYAAYGNAVLPQPGSLPFVQDQQIPGYPPQAPLAQGNQLPATSLGIGMLTGQGLSQGLPQPTNLVKDLAKATLSTFTSTTQAVFPSMASMTSKAPIAPSTSKAPPVNVVITSSDPLPTNVTSIPQPILSVTIPPQHIKGNVQPHNYQIPLPASGITSTTPSILSKPPPVISTQSLLSNVAPPIFSAVSPSKTPSRNISLGLQIEKSLDKTFSPNTSLNKSSVSVDEHDPCPDFKPIIPLPDEVPVNTGEENETVLFCERAKLFRYVNREWKDRGVGNLKILQHKETGKIRVLMRRDQVHKICANHFITKDLNISPMPSDERACNWAAQDFADGELTVEQFCARFKTTEEAKKFINAIEDAKKKVPDSNSEITITPVVSKVETSLSSNSLGGFVFKSTPSFKPKEIATITTTAAVSVQNPEPSKPSPFSNFTFGSSKTITSGNLFGNIKPSSISSTFSPVVISTTTAAAIKNPQQETDSNDQVEDFEPTAEFTPVVALPDLIEVKTGDEDAEVLFDCRAKLFKLVPVAEGKPEKEWKERGVGNIKVLKEDTVRLVMRREQVHKVCLNHQVLKDMVFQVRGENPKAVLWSAKDFSEGVLTPETFTVRFKTEEDARRFIDVLQTAQSLLNERNTISNKHHKPGAAQKSPTGFSDKFKQPKGGWECKICYIYNEGKTNHCVACETPKNDSIGKKTDDSGKSGPTFSFGVTKLPTTLFGATELSFKPAEGSWECQTCLVRNVATTSKCVSCETPKEGASVTSNKGVNLDTPGLKFTFGVTPKEPAAPVVKPPQTKPKGFGDDFKPKPNSWECKTCFVRNEEQVKYCVSCEGPKDDTVPKRETNKGVNLETPGLKFNFGVAPAAAADKKTFTFGDSGNTFSFGKPAAPANSSTFMFTPSEPIKPAPVSKFTFAPTPKAEEKQDGDKFVFGSPTKHEFEFTPRSPNRKISTGQGDEESDGSYVDEDVDNIYFKPVIPLPEKVEVKTGEEEEDILYCHRAKLFRFVTGEWKERGIGDVKILRRGDNGKLRVVMRREQIMKICLNHTLGKEIKYVPMDDKTWLFHAADFSEGELSPDKFCLRFKTPEVAQEFKTAIDDAVGGTASAIKVPTTKADSDNEVIILDEPISPEEIEEAKRLSLPYTFFQYRKKKEYCTCAQCAKDDEYFKGTEFASHTPALPKFTGLKIPDTQISSTVTSTPSTTAISSANQLFSFASPFTPTTATSSQSFFGSPATAGGLFSSALQKTESKTSTESPLKSLLSTPSTLGKTGGNLFVTPTTTPSVFGGNIFGGSSKTPVFGSTASATPIFGANSNSGGSMFGGTTSTSSAFSTSILGSSAGTSPLSSLPSTTTTSATSLFGSSVFGNIGNQGNTTSSSSSTNIFQTAPAKPATGLFGNLPGSVSDTSKLKETDEVVLKCKSEISFATLAANTASDALPLFAKKDEGIQPFSFLGAGAPVFGLTTMKKIDKNKSLDGSKAEEEEEEQEQPQNEEEYDPHYEPIIPMPEAIQVTTGEENEEIKFSERAKLYRFNEETKEWKERGVGQIKILFHPENKTYRLILRREQVHKVVLNQLIQADLDVKPLSLMETAWMWSGYNFTDDGQQMELLALRFKTVELAHKFKEAVDLAICKVIEINNKRLSQIPTTVADYHEISKEKRHEEEYVEDEEDDEDDDDEDALRSPLYESESNNLVLSYQNEAGQWVPEGTGMVGVYYYSDLYACRINFVRPDGECLSNSIIGSNTLMEMEDNECTWRAVERVDETDCKWRNIKITFPDEDQAHHFHSGYLEGVNYAQEVGIDDDIDIDYEEAED